MDLTVMQVGLLAGIFLLANLPWLSERCFLILQCERKSPLLRLVEWFALYWIAGGIALAMEYKTTGSLYAQDWEFYWVTLFLFMVFAFPGFIYRYVR